jgi:uncharacterized protein (TIGR03067 family)
VKTISLCVLAFVVAVFGSDVAIPAPVPPEAKNDAKTELTKLTGRWKVVSWQRNGVARLTDDAAEKLLTFKKDGVFAWGDSEESGKITRIDPAKREIDYVFANGGYCGKTQKAIYKLEGDTFTDCFSEPGADRPTEFKSTKDNGWSIVVYKRVKKID